MNEGQNNYPLEQGEYEVPVKGRTGPKRSNASAWLKHGGRIRIDDDANPDFWVELTLPEEYIAACMRNK